MGITFVDHQKKIGLPPVLLVEVMQNMIIQLTLLDGFINYSS